MSSTQDREWSEAEEEVDRAELVDAIWPADREQPSGYTLIEENEAERLAIASGLGVSEWPAFLSQARQNLSERAVSESAEPPAGEAHCTFIPETRYVMAGWGCGKCRVYNGVWRTACKQCKHKRCIYIAPDVIERQQEIRKDLGYTDD